MKSVGQISKQGVKTVVGTDFYTACMTDSYVRALLEFCIRDADKTAELMEKVQVVNHTNRSNGVIMFSKKEFKVIGKRIQEIDHALTKITSMTLQELKEIDQHRTRIVEVFTSKSEDGKTHFERLDDALIELYRYLTGSNVKRREGMSALEIAQFGAKMIMHWHFFLLSRNLKDIGTAQVPLVTAFLSKFMGKRTVQSLVPVISTGLLESRKWGGYRVTGLYTDHPWDLLVTWIAIVAGSLAGVGTKLLMTITVMTFGKPYLAAVLIFFLLACVLHPSPPANWKGGVKNFVRLTQRQLALHHTDVTSVYRKAVRAVGDDTPALKRHMRYLQPIVHAHDSDSNSIHDSARSVNSRNSK